MLKSFLAAASLAVVVTSLGCSSPAESSAPPSDEALSADGTLSLSAATAKIGAIRATFDPTGDNALLFDPTLTDAYLAAVKPVFAKTAAKDKVSLGGSAFTYVSSDIQSGAIFDLGLFDDAVATYEQVWEFSSYWGGLSSNAEFWTKESDLLARSPAGALSDLQILELVTRATGTPADLFAGLKALGWTAAKDATSAQARTLIADETVFGTLDQVFFGGDDTSAHDLDESDAFAVSVFQRSYSKLRLLTAGDSGEILVDLGGHIASVHQYAGHKATKGIALAESELTSGELKSISEYLSE